MARIKYSGLIDEIAGSIGGTTFQKNRYGYSVKSKPRKTKTGTLSQIARRTSMYEIQQAWIGLSPGNRSNWDTYAQTFPRPSRLNPNASLNGFNYFGAYNLLRVLHGGGFLANPNGAQRTFSFDGIDFDSTLGAMDVTSNITVSGGNWILLFFASRPVPPTSQLRQNRTRFIQSAVVSGNATLDIKGNYEAIFGISAVTDDVIQYRRVYLNQTNGQIFDSGIQLGTFIEV